MTAKEAFEKTEQLVAAYERGDLLGGNPMQWIEKYGEQCFNAAREKYEKAYPFMQQGHELGKTVVQYKKYETFSDYLKSINQ